MSVYDMLGIDETEGIDPSELEAIKNTLKRISVSAAGVAKHNDTTDTLAILREIERFVRGVASSDIHSAEDLQQQLNSGSSRQPVKELGSGSTDSTPQQAPTAPAPPTPNDLQQALDIIMAAPAATSGQKAAVTRIFFKVDDHMTVDDSGTPIELINSRRELKTQKDRAEAAEKKLDEIQDETKEGSLAKQLKDAKAKVSSTSSTAKVVEVDKVVAGLEMLRDDYVATITGPGKTKAKGKDEAIQAINKEIAKVKS